MGDAEREPSGGLERACDKVKLVEKKGKKSLIYKREVAVLSGRKGKMCVFIKTKG